VVSDGLADTVLHARQVLERPRTSDGAGTASQSSTRPRNLLAGVNRTEIDEISYRRERLRDSWTVPLDYLIGIQRAGCDERLDGERDRRRQLVRWQSFGSHTKKLKSARLPRAVDINNDALLCNFRLRALRLRLGKANVYGVGRRVVLNFHFGTQL
jgi:hypothetical protein